MHVLLGVRSDCIVGNTLEERIDVVRELGFDFLELVLSKERTANLTRFDITYYRQLREKVGFCIPQTSFGLFPGFGSRDEEGQKATLNQLRQFIDLTAALDGDVVLVACCEDSPDIQSFLPSYQLGFLEAADHAASQGVKLALEPVGHYPPSLVDQLVRHLAHPGVLIYYDMGNCLYGNEDPLESIRLSVDLTAAVHIKGGPDGPLEAMPLGDILQVLQDHGYGGRGCLEIPAANGTNSHLQAALGLLRTSGYSN